MTLNSEIIQFIQRNNGVTTKDIAENLKYAVKTIQNNIVKLLNRNDIYRTQTVKGYVYYARKLPSKKKLTRNQLIYCYFHERLTPKEINLKHPDWNIGHIRSACYYARNNQDKVINAIKQRDENKNNREIDF